jgi:glycine betaine/proline transport system ATP-binding protein
VSDVYTTSPSTPISELLSTAIETRYPIAMIDEDGRFHGAVSRAAIIAEVNKGLEGTDIEAPQTLAALQDAQNEED